jgi:alpha-tubulin suppressor-like RCC1 family protein
MAMSHMRLASRFAPVLVGLLVALAGCDEDTGSPTAPESSPALEPAIASLLSFTQVSVGGMHTCGLAADGRVYCWGDNVHGQLGDGTRTGHPTPVAVAGAVRFIQVSAGAFHTCAVTAEYRAYCWGQNEDGRVGDGTTTDRWAPTLVAGGRRFVHVRSGTYHTCGVNGYNVAFCWGANLFGELGIGAGFGFAITTPTRVAGGLSFRRVNAGGGFTCGVTTGDRAYCWGYNLNGQLGDGTRISRQKPVAVAGGLSFRQVIAGGGVISNSEGDVLEPGHACGLTTDNRAYCWGANSDGQLGDGTRSTGRLKPFAVLGGLRFRQVIAGLSHTCGVTTSDLAYCWGSNNSGVLGTGASGLGLTTPAAVAGGLQFSGVSAGPLGIHVCGITTGNRIYCWGYNAAGQLGDGTTVSRSTPVAVAGQM